ISQAGMPALQAAGGSFTMDIKAKSSPIMTDRQQSLTEALESRILVIDGAMGQLLQLNMTVADYGGAHLENLTDYIVKTRPDVVAGIHKLYLEAGADIIETNTFNGTHLVLSDFHVGDEAYALNKAAAELARKAAAEYSTPDKPRWVAGSMGPTTRAISVTGGVTFEELRQNYYDQARALVDGGVDVLLLETCNDSISVKAGLLAIGQVGKELGLRFPIMLSATIESVGNAMLAGQGVDAFWASVSHADLISVGLNCGTGPEFMTDHLRTLHELATTRISCYPNAGLPNEELKYDETPESFAANLERFVNNGWLNIVGGCCGTTPAHIQAIAQMVAGKRPRP